MRKGEIGNIRSQKSFLQPVNAPSFKGGKSTSPISEISTRHNGFRSPRNGHSEIEYDKSDEEDYQRPNYEVGKPRKLAVEDDEDYIKTRAPTRAGFYPETRRNSSAGIGNRRGKISKGDQNLFRSSSYDPIKLRRSQNPRKVKVVTFYKNGDSNFMGFQFWLRPGRDARNLDVLCRQLSARIPGLPLGVRYIFNMDGDVIRRLEEIQDGGTYVCSSDGNFKEQVYGMKLLSSWRKVAKSRPKTVKRYQAFTPAVLTPIHPDGHTSIHSDGHSPFQPDDHSPFPAFNPNRKKRDSRGGKRIWVVNIDDHDSKGDCLLSKKMESFEDVLKILGHVLKMRKVKAMYTLNGEEVRSLSQLSHYYDNTEQDTFFLEEAKDSSLGSMKQRNRSFDRDSNPSPSLPSSKGTTDVQAWRKDAVTVTIRGQDHVIAKPSHVPPSNASAPEKQLRLDWVYPFRADAYFQTFKLEVNVYGFQGADTKRNLWVLPTGELLYFVATVVVMYDVQRRDRHDDKQRHYTEHTEDVTCLAVHPGNELAASGQKEGWTQDGKDPGPHIRIWSLATLTTLRTLTARKTFSDSVWIGVGALAFSAQDGGKHLAGVMAGEVQELLVWDWNVKPKEAVARAQADQGDILGVAFHPAEDLLISHGNALSAWMERGSAMLERDDLVEEAHEGPVSTLLFSPIGSLYSGGEEDRRVVSWDSDTFQQLEAVKLPEIVGGVRAIQAGRSRVGSHEELFVGTTKNLVLQGTLETTFQPVVFGHASQLWALAVHPSQPVFATAGYDRNIVKWRAHEPEWRVHSECSCAAWNEDGSLLAVGSITGHVTVLRGEDGRLVDTFVGGGSHVTCASFSPDGSQLSLGVGTGNVYIYRVDRAGNAFRRGTVLNVLKESLTWEQSLPCLAR
ncbi:unnamed protein product [Darwinula stevensoni]|uniref:Doublecortin domain-containing protein n=1 Tax=Darwinula stevensoni TaxID=69355 RepID=A0A7R9FQ77_9CRUS|nr:unnamed protein product [Darwinula stevensoni]CAG0899201.1 unnamed protein product [Darwinula stevensoni]